MFNRQSKNSQNSNRRKLEDKSDVAEVTCSFKKMRTAYHREYRAKLLRYMHSTFP